MGDMVPLPLRRLLDCRPIGSSCCRSNFRRLSSRARSRWSRSGGALRRAGEDRRRRPCRACRHRPCHILASGRLRLATTTISLCARFCPRSMILIARGGGRGNADGVALPRLIAALALAGLSLSLPDTARMLASNIEGYAAAGRSDYWHSHRICGRRCAATRRQTRGSPTIRSIWRI